MLCKMSVNELYCSADSFKILGMSFQPIFLSRRIRLIYQYVVCVCPFQLLNYLTDCHEACIITLKMYFIPRPCLLISYNQ
jgi:hypothetical protein